MSSGHDVPLSILASAIVLSTLGFSMMQLANKKNERFVDTLQDKFLREARFKPRGDQWHIDRRRGIGTNKRPSI